MPLTENKLNLSDVRKFYWNEFIVIYDILNANLKQLPSELHFEITIVKNHESTRKNTNF